MPLNAKRLFSSMITYILDLYSHSGDKKCSVLYINYHVYNSNIGLFSIRNNCHLAYSPLVQLIIIYIKTKTKTLIWMFRLTFIVMTTEQWLEDLEQTDVSIDSDTDTTRLHRSQTTCQFPKASRGFYQYQFSRSYDKFCYFAGPKTSWLCYTISKLKKYTIMWPCQRKPNLAIVTVTANWALCVIQFLVVDLHILPVRFTLCVFWCDPDRETSA